MAIFNSELQNPNTKFFILDTGRIEHRDIDFEMYSWNKHRYNLMNPGDVFIYRKPQKVSENDTTFIIYPPQFFRKEISKT